MGLAELRGGISVRGIFLSPLPSLICMVKEGVFKQWACLGPARQASD